VSTPHEKSVNTVEAKNNLNALIAESTHSKKPVLVEKRGKPVAVIIDYESYQTLKHQSPSKKRRPLTEDLENFHRQMRKKYKDGTGDSVSILRKLRSERNA
jgi:prevent-host-death family protein